MEQPVEQRGGDGVCKVPAPFREAAINGAARGGGFIPLVSCGTVGLLYWTNQTNPDSERIVKAYT